MDPKEVESTYDRMANGDRNPYLTRARAAARLTIPRLMREDGANASTPVKTPWQTVGARGVNNLAAALTLALFPPNQSVCRFTLDEMAIRKKYTQAGLATTELDAIRTEIDQNLQKAEKAVLQDIEDRRVRVTAFEAFKHLIVAGNGLMFVENDGPVRFFALDKYVVRRNPNGSLALLIVRETLGLSEASQPVLDSLGMSPEGAKLIEQQAKDPHARFPIYTVVNQISESRFETYQTVYGVPIEGTKGYYKRDTNPWIPVRMVSIDGEDYGGSFIEEYAGDLKSLEALSQSIVQAAAAAAKILFFVAPNSSTKKRDVAASESGDVLTGRGEDVSVLQFDKQADMSVAANVAEKIREGLNYNFLLTDQMVRNAERVTAEEVQMIVRSVEKQFGGLYSLQSQEFQSPLIRRIVFMASRSGKIPKIPMDLIRPTIVTGIEALGRGQDLQRLDQFMLGLRNVLSPEQIEAHVDLGEWLKRRANALSLDTAGLVLTDEQRQQRAQAMQQQANNQQGSAAMADAASKIAVEAVKNPNAAAAAASLVRGRQARK